MSIPKDVRILIASHVTDPKDLIALGGTDKAWRVVVSAVLRTKIETIFGNSFIGLRNPVTVAAELWAPLRPRTTQLSIVLPLQNNPISDEMKQVLSAARTGSIGDLKLMIQVLKDPLELTELKFGAEEQPRLGRDGVVSPPNLLTYAAQSGDVDKVQELIHRATPIGVGVNGMFTSQYTPLMTAAIKGNDVILRLLLENGASFSVKVDECIDSPYREIDYVPSELLYLTLVSLCHLEKISEGHVRCVTLAMRSWRHENGFENIKDDPRLHRIARRCSSRARAAGITQLLKAYGVDENNPKFAPKTAYGIWDV